MKRPHVLISLFLTLAFSGIAIAAELDQAQPASATVAQASPELGAAIRAYLLANPDVVREALEELQRRRIVAEEEASKQALASQADALFGNAYTPVLGNPDGDVTVVEFFDYHCGYCKRSAPAVAALLASDPKVKLVMKEFPILGPDSVLAAKSALAAAKQGRYQEFHDALFQSEALDEAGLDALATRLGLDLRRFHADRDSAETAAELDGNAAIAEALGIRGTPAFIVGDRLIPNALDTSALTSLVDAVRTGRAATR